MLKVTLEEVEYLLNLAWCWVKPKLMFDLNLFFPTKSIMLPLSDHRFSSATNAHLCGVDILLLKEDYNLIRGNQHWWNEVGTRAFLQVSLGWSDLRLFHGGETVGNKPWGSHMWGRGKDSHLPSKGRWMDAWDQSSQNWWIAHKAD